MVVQTRIQDLEGTSKETKWAEEMAQCSGTLTALAENPGLVPTLIRWFTNFCNSGCRESNTLASLGIYKHVVHINSHRHTCMEKK